MKRPFIFLAPLILASCIHWDSKDKEPETPIDPQTKAMLDARVSDAEKALDQQNYQKAEILFAKFEADYPQNIYLNRSKIGHGRALAGEGKYAESVNYYRQVIDTSLSHPEFIGLASYYASFSFEGMGDEAKTLASLMDAKNQAASLPANVAKAELPARLAAFYNREGGTEESRKYYREAEQGVAQLYQDNSPASAQAKARTYFLMGELSSNQVTVDSLPAQMDTLALTQIFLLRSIEQNQTPWSSQALENLQSNYRDIWNAVLQIPRNKALDAFAAEQEQREAQIRAVGRLQELTQKLRSFESPEDHSNNALEKSLFRFLDQIDKHSQEMLASLSPELPLTPEAQQRESLHREGVIRGQSEQKPAEVLPEKPAGTVAPVSKSPAPVDPNLQGR